MIEEENGQNDSRSIVFIDGLWKMGEFIVHIHYNKRNGAFALDG